MHANAYPSLPDPCNHTRTEILQQPALWAALANRLAQQQAELDAFLGHWLREPSHQVIFTGAGSSGFIADMVAAHINAQWPANVCAVHTTSLLTHPQLYLQRNRPTLLVSFGRSGSSPESVAAVALVRDCVTVTRFIDITCNAEGELARLGKQHADTCTVLMPPESCDRAFAMTSSLTCMLLAALTLFENAPWPTRLARLHDLAKACWQALTDWDAPLRALAQQPYARVIYLGSGPLEAAAQEAALKLLELTAGRVVAVANTPLGFRHGPKSLLDGNTLVVMLRSAQVLARRYEQDLLDELRRDNIAAQVVSVGAQLDTAAPGDFSLALDADIATLPDPWLAPLWLTLPQRLALLRSEALGLQPDNPFPDGTVNRVVQGVRIHAHVC
ncbi:MAG TPA: SIS domain-containing protein [Thermomonas sp.]|jgi:tagatose-6-phosphate ketose/aldose isomerase|uniref:SIS domain-containing protein n=1 Tax=Thermomonas sp. TaxID=1971895 RepID=UPI002D143B71|nr:SIS domain-containing protein [Thermomonas sp.]HOV96305.1 SIS domain-containing protein [Thermomonas sp.]